MEKPESLAEKYKKYKTTLKSASNEVFATKERDMVDFSSPAQQEQTADFIDYSARESFDIGGTDFQAQYNDLFKQEDFSQSDLQDVTRQFQAQYQQMLTQPDALYKELSVKPYQKQGGYKNPRSYSNRGSANYSGNNSTQRRQRSSSDSAYEAEQPILIAWVFSTIRYVREHPLMSGFIALTVLGLLSLLQVVIRRFARPFG